MKMKKVARSHTELKEKYDTVQEGIVQKCLEIVGTEGAAASLEPTAAERCPIRLLCCCSELHACD
jgi:hypothetical protein